MYASSVAPKFCCYVVCCCILVLLGSFCWKGEPHQELSSDAGLEETLVRSLTEQDADSLQLLARIEAWLEPSFRALPKAAKDRVGPRAAAHLVHVFFNANFGINIQGLRNDNPFRRGQVKVLAEVSLMQGRASKLSQSMAAALPASYAYTLRELAAYVATLQRLLLKEIRVAFKVAWRLRNHTANELLPRKELKRVLRSAMILVHDWDRVLLQSSTLKQGVDDEMMRRFRVHEDSAAQSLESWRELKKLASATIRRVLPTAQSYSYKAALPAFLELFQEYGPFQNADCQEMKSHLRRLDETGRGRVSLKAFYGVPEVSSSKYYFRESLPKLEGLGLVDSSQPMPSVLVTNYVGGPNNCVAPNPHFSICCIDECLSLLRQVEANVQAPTAQFTKLFDITRQLTPNRTLTLELADSLHRIARLSSGGEIPLHGRLFAEWLHFWQPYKCPFPQAPGVEIEQAIWKDRKHAWSVQEKEKYIQTLSDLPNASGAKDLLSLWSDEEVLPLVENTWDFWSTVEKILQYFFSFQFVAQLLIIISGMRDLALVVQESCPGCRRRQGKHNMRKSDLDETEPAQEKRDGKARCKDGEDKKANVVEAAEAKPGQESSAKRSRQKGGETLKQQPRKEAQKARKRGKVATKDAKPPKGMAQSWDMVPQPGNYEADRKLDEVQNEHFAIAKIFADAFEEPSVDIAEDGASEECATEASQGHADPDLATSDFSTSTPDTIVQTVEDNWQTEHANEEMPPQTKLRAGRRATSEEVTMADWLCDPPQPEFGQDVSGDCEGVPVGEPGPAEAKALSASQWLAQAAEAKAVEEAVHFDDNLREPMAHGHITQDLVHDFTSQYSAPVGSSSHGNTPAQGFRLPPGLELWAPAGLTLPVSL